MDEKKLAEVLIGEPALSWKMRDNGQFVVVDPKGNKWVFYPDQVKEAQASRSEPKARLASAPMEEKEEEKPKRSYKPRAKKA